MILIYEKGKKGSIEVIAEDLQTRLEGYGIDIHKESYDLGECMMAADESKVYMSGKKISRSRGFASLIRFHFYFLLWFYQ